jgi:hypothetical protein
MVRKPNEASPDGTVARQLTAGWMPTRRTFRSAGPRSFGRRGHRPPCPAGLAGGFCDTGSLVRR